MALLLGVEFCEQSRVQRAIALALTLTLTITITITSTSASASTSTSASGSAVREAGVAERGSRRRTQILQGQHGAHEHALHLQKVGWAVNHLAPAHGLGAQGPVQDASLYARVDGKVVLQALVAKLAPQRCQLVLELVALAVHCSAPLPGFVEQTQQVAALLLGLAAHKLQLLAQDANLVRVAVALQRQLQIHAAIGQIQQRAPAPVGVRAVPERRREVVHSLRELGAQVCSELLVEPGHVGLGQGHARLRGVAEAGAWGWGRGCGCGCGCGCGGCACACACACSSSSSSKRRRRLGLGLGLGVGQVHVEPLEPRRDVGAHRAQRHPHPL